MLFKNAALCDYRGTKMGDVRVQDGIITHIGHLSAYPNEQVFEVGGRVLLPAMIDLNIAPKSLSLSRKSLLSLAGKALKGGVGSMLLYPHTSPSCSENGSIELIKSLNAQSPIHLLPAISPLNAQGKLSDISTLHASGARAIFAFSDTPAHTLMRIAQYAQMLDIPLICFCQDRDVSDGVMNEGLLSASLGLPSIPAYSQTKEVAKVAEMLFPLPIKLVFDTLVYPRSFEILSRAYGLDSINAWSINAPDSINTESAKNIESANATHTESSTKFATNAHNDYNRLPPSFKAQFFTQTSIHHLALDESLCDNYNTAAKLNPPLVDKASQNTLIDLLQNGSIHTLTSLQCADFNAKKDQVFELASFGIDALEVYFSLLYTYLHKAHNIPLEFISRLTSYNPAQILNLNKGALDEGKIAEFIIVNPDISFVLQDNFSPYNQQILHAKIEAFFSCDRIHLAQKE